MFVSQFNDDLSISRHVRHSWTYNTFEVLPKVTLTTSNEQDIQVL